MTHIFLWNLSNSIISGEQCNILHQAQEIMEIEYGFVYKRSSKPLMKGLRVETIESALDRLEGSNTFDILAESDN